MAQAGSAKSRYDKLASDRTQFLQRARHNALLTLPSLMPLEGQGAQSHLIEPYQGLGSRGVVHLSSRMLVGFLPAGRPYMRLDLPPQVKMQLKGEVDTEMTKGLATSEQLVQGEVEAKGWRESTLMSLQQLMVAGTVCEYLMENNRIRVFRLDSFVARRNHDGKLLELIICEKFDRDAVPVGLKDPTGRTGMENKDEQVELYTWITFEQKGKNEFYRRVQQWGDGAPAGASKTWPANDLPYLVLRWSSTPGEDYGRSKVEEHIGDLRSLDALEKAQLEMAAMASRNFIMIAPGAMASSMKNRLVRALNGDVVIGDPTAVELKSFDNSSGYQITSNQVAIIRENLAHAFLLMSGAQRQAERVTATEIERDIQELEAALGGTFSSLSLEMMEARTRILIQNMIKQEALPPFPEGAVVPTILTGLEALSRERDVSRAMQAAELTRAFLGTDESASHVAKIEHILGRAFVGLGFPDAVRTPEERQASMQQEAQAKMAAEMATKSAPGVARELAKKGAEDG